MSKKYAALFVALLLIGGCVTTKTEVKSDDTKAVSEKLLSKVNFLALKSETLAVSYDNMHIAYASRDGDKQYVTFDQEEGKRYDSITVSPMISPDGGYVAYVAKRNNKQFAVVGDKEGKEYDEIPVKSFCFSPDGKRIAYVAKEGDKQLLVVDGVEGERYDEVFNNSIAFSPNGKHIGYIGRNGTKISVIIDGKEYDTGVYYPLMVVGQWKIIFYPDETFSYIAVKEDSIYFVKEAIKK